MQKAQSWNLRKIHSNCIKWFWIIQAGVWRMGIDNRGHPTKAKRKKMVSYHKMQNMCNLEPCTIQSKWPEQKVSNKAGLIAVEERKETEVKAGAAQAECNVPFNYETRFLCRAVGIVIPVLRTFPPESAPLWSPDIKGFLPRMPYLCMLSLENPFHPTYFQLFFVRIYVLWFLLP